MPYYHLWTGIERNFTSGDGYLDKLCMELIGLPSSRCRPPTRDVRERYRAEALAMMRAVGVPRLVAAGAGGETDENASEYRRAG
jgi:4-hydroxy-tetrahydrodipicolinate synthase